MTSINVVPVEELTNGHLAIEHYELVRVYRLVRIAIERGEQPNDWRNVPTYRMGASHVRFFYPRLGYVRNREIDIHVEMLFRGIPLVREEEDLSDIPDIWFGSYEPDDAARLVNRQRIAERNLDMERKYMRGYFID